MHYAILNSSGNALEWFTDEGDARTALAEIMGETPDADVDLVAFEGPGRPVEPVSPAARSAWPAARLVWSHTQHQRATSRNAGNLIAISATMTYEDDDGRALGEQPDGTDDRVTPLA